MARRPRKKPVRTPKRPGRPAMGAVMASPGLIAVALGLPACGSSGSTGDGTGTTVAPQVPPEDAPQVAPTGTGGTAPTGTTSPQVPPPPQIAPQVPPQDPPPQPPQIAPQPYYPTPPPPTPIDAGSSTSDAGPPTTAVPDGSALDGATDAAPVNTIVPPQPAPTTIIPPQPAPDTDALLIEPPKTKAARRRHS